MTRVLDALKALQNRDAGAPASGAREASPAASAAAVNITSASVPVPKPTPRIAPSQPLPSIEQPAAGTERARHWAEAARTTPTAHAVANMCLLPTASVVADHYHELAERIAEQRATNYCNVLLFVSPDPAVEPCFSMTHLAQAFSLQSAGDVLLVDGDLRHGRLSKTVCPAGRGMIEAMLGTAHWPEIVHPTTTPRIDFVGRGEGQIPTFERPEFGWEALRPKYRAVLIGVSDAREPETAWLATRCDAVYFLVSRPHTKRQTATEAAALLRAAGANLLGCIVVND